MRGYIFRHTKRDGSRTVSWVDDQGNEEELRHVPAGPGIIVKSPRQTKGQMFDKIHGNRLGREEIDRQSNGQRALKRDAKLRTKGARRRLASIPPHIWHREVAHNGAEAMRDPKRLRRLIAEHGLTM